MKFTQIPSDTFKRIQMNAGIIVKSFTPSTQTIGEIIGATSGGVNFVATPTYSDLGEDVDNCPENTMELKHLDSWEVTMSGSFVTVDSGLIKSLVGAGDAVNGKIAPRADLSSSDFADIWWVGDYSDVNTGASAGYVAIHLMNALSTNGFALQSTDKAKGAFEFTYTAHYSIEDQSTVPFEIYIAQGSPEKDTYRITFEGAFGGNGDTVTVEGVVTTLSTTKGLTASQVAETLNADAEFTEKYAVEAKTSGTNNYILLTETTGHEGSGIPVVTVNTTGALTATVTKE